jgi:hypothetical protein
MVDTLDLMKLQYLCHPSFVDYEVSLAGDLANGVL